MLREMAEPVSGPRSRVPWSRASQGRRPPLASSAVNKHHPSIAHRVRAAIAKLINVTEQLQLSKSQM